MGSLPTDEKWTGVGSFASKLRGKKDSSGDLIGKKQAPPGRNRLNYWEGDASLSASDETLAQRAGMDGATLDVVMTFWKGLIRQKLSRVIRLSEYRRGPRGVFPIPKYHFR